jgi:pimeloyl-ACP methyl ester carboxylesterase
MKTNLKTKHFEAKVLYLVFLLVLSLPIGAYAQLSIPLPDNCSVGTLPTDSGYQITLTCMPVPADEFNGTIVVYAHGYVNPQEDLSLPEEELVAFWPVVEILLEHGMIFATTSCSKTGFAIEQCGDNINDLVDFVKDQIPQQISPKVLIAGASEGAGVASMLVEKYPDIYDGALTLCGPVGGMPYQIDYLGDFRVVFDYFFPDVIPRDGIYDLTSITLDEWNELKEVIKSAVDARPDLAKQVFKVTGAAAAPGLLGLSAVNILKFSVVGVKDLVETSGGKPFGNKWSWYRGSKNDRALNAGVERVGSTRKGRKYVRKFYNTTGDLQQPVVSLHTIQDDVVPYRHELLYKFKVWLQGNRRQFISLPVIRFGHCNFEPTEVFGAFWLLLMMAD